MTEVPLVGRPEAPEDRFRGLFTRHYAAVRRFALRRVGVDDADDVAEEVFTTAWRRIESVPAEPATLPWLYGVARRTVSNHLRSDRRRRRLFARAASQPDSPTPADPDADLLAALARLSEGDREVLRLVAWEELEPREMAAVLGCSAGTAAVRLHRARRRLSTELQRMGWTS